MRPTTPMTDLSSRRHALKAWTVSFGSRAESIRNADAKGPVSAGSAGQPDRRFPQHRRGGLHSWRASSLPRTSGQSGNDQEADFRLRPLHGCTAHLALGGCHHGEMRSDKGAPVRLRSWRVRRPKVLRHVKGAACGGPSTRVLAGSVSEILTLSLSSFQMSAQVIDLTCPDSSDHLKPGRPPPTIRTPMP